MKYGVTDLAYESNNQETLMLHWLPPDAFRMTACGETTGMVFSYMMEDEILGQPLPLCPRCWVGHQFANQTPHRTPGKPR